MQPNLTITQTFRSSPSILLYKIKEKFVVHISINENQVNLPPGKVVPFQNRRVFAKKIFSEIILANRDFYKVDIRK